MVMVTIRPMLRSRHTVIAAHAGKGYVIGQVTILQKRMGDNADSVGFKYGVDGGRMGRRGYRVCLAWRRGRLK
jgi:hypothetical protein